ncbi:MAG: hypothetical protein M3R57_05000, partial [Chloroflexota bacterium]|nr:hypothetical protein [Chloroflexota bacterium]
VVRLPDGRLTATLLARDAADAENAIAVGGDREESGVAKAALWRQAAPVGETGSGSGRWRGGGWRCR